MTPAAMCHVTNRLRPNGFGARLYAGRMKVFRHAGRSAADRWSGKARMKRVRLGLALEILEAWVDQSC